MRNNILKSAIKVMCFLLLGFCIATVSNAQPNPGPGNQGSGTGPTTDGPTVPFDGGMSLMLAASGISYGVKRLRKVPA